MTHKPQSMTVDSLATRADYVDDDLYVDDFLSGDDGRPVTFYFTVSKGWEADERGREYTTFDCDLISVVIDAEGDYGPAVIMTQAEAEEFFGADVIQRMITSANESQIDDPDGDAADRAYENSIG